MTHTRKGRAAKKRRQAGAAARAVAIDGDRIAPSNATIIEFPTNEHLSDLIEAEVKDEPR